MRPRELRFPALLLAALLAAVSWCPAAGTNDFPQASEPASAREKPEAPRPANWAVRLDRPSLSNLYMVTTNLYRGAQPDSQGMAELKSMGVKMVLNLRSLHSDKDELLGIDLKQARLHTDPWYVSEKEVVGFLKLATNTNNLPMFVHCQRGADRTGLMCAMYRVAVCGWTKEQAIEEMRKGGFHFNPLWGNLVHYVRKADVEKLKREAGIASPTPASAEARNADSSTRSSAGAPDR